MKPIKGLMFHREAAVTNKLIMVGMFCLALSACAVAPYDYDEDD